MMVVVVVDEIMYFVEKRLLVVDYLLMFEELEYNHLEHIEVVYDHYYQQ